MKIILISLIIILFSTNPFAQKSFEIPQEINPSQFSIEAGDFYNTIIDALNNNNLEKITNSELKSTNGYPLKTVIQQSGENLGWVNDYKYINYFDERNNLIRDELQSWKDDSTWYTYTRAFYNYDQNDNRIEFIDQMLQSTQWVNDRRITYGYSLLNNLLVELHQFWQNNDWTNSSKIVRDYIGNNKSDEVNLSWYTNRWENEQHSSFVYNSANNLTQEINQNWESGNWVNYHKLNLTYDDAQNLIEKLYNYWENSQWNSGTKLIYTYDGNKNLLESLWVGWNGSGWTNLELDVSYYDENFNNIERIQYNWEDTSWTFGKRWFYDYDLNNNNTSEIGQYFTNLNWKNDYKIEYAYDENSNLIERMHQFWRNEQWENELKFIFSYIKEIEDTVVNGNQTAGYILYQNYPNPFNPKTTITYKIPIQSFVSIQIFNSLGEYISSIINEEKVPGIYEVKFYGENLPSGVYLYQLNVGKYSKTKKMILLK
jgi:hypothetical protein